ncbi:Glucosidase II beta subunit-like, partial [Trinorchestia longiramus]
ADGTICELSGNPRVTDVLYVCYEHGRNDVYSVKETSTCEYEIVILTDALCQHPLYKKKEKQNIPIHCLSTMPGLRRPKELIRTEAHSLKMKMMPETKVRPRLASLLWLSGAPESGAMALGKVDTELAKVKAMLLNTDDEEDDDDGFGTDDGATTRDRKPFPPRPLTQDQSAVKSFLTGEHCLDGGIGWWHYEFCYGRHVTQFHVNKDGSKITILLGTFNPLKHIEWIKKHPSKAPNGLQVTHLYSDGAVCDVSGKPRVTEVRLKCYPRSEKVNVGTVALYLIEPEPCYYILGVETGLVCDLLHDADEYGLLQHDIFDQTQVEG